MQIDITGHQLDVTNSMKDYFNSKFERVKRHFYIKNKPYKLTMTLLLMCHAVFALDSDKNADFVLEGDNFKNLTDVISGETKIKYWGNVSIQQGTLKINSEEAVIFNGKNGISNVVLTGDPVTMEQVIDAEFGKTIVKANKIDFMMEKDMLFMSGDVVIKSKIQGEMSGEKITMNLKTKEITGVKSENKPLN